MKKLIILILLALSSITYGQLSQINVGTSANDGTGESLRSAFQKVNLGITQINTNTGNIALKLAIADTSNMLLRYINKADTALMLSNYAKISATMSTSHAANAITGTDITNWGTAYTDRLKWDGGSTGLTAATGRSSLGGTTVGQAIFTLTNPSAITFLRMNADNSVTALSAANFKTALSLTASDVGLGNVTNESKATMFTNPVFTGVQKVSTTDTLSTKAYARSVGLGGGGGVSEATVSAIVSDSITARLNGATEISDVAVMLADTVPIVTFSLGAGLPADTACFNNGVLAGSFYNGGSDTLIIKKLVGILKEGTGTETIGVQVAWHTTFLSASATLLNSSALTVNSITTGTEDTSFANAKIPPNVFVWCILSGASEDNKPTYLNVTLSGNKIPKY